jgi:acyl-CoA synthetase (AMP-forming)/AMP-acid ligase II/pimeloyl-ACP methyl ester carboxylesterase
MKSDTKSELLPFKSNFMSIDGFQMHYIDEGRSENQTQPVVVLLHGNPTWCFMYRKLIEALRSNYRVIAPDHIGCGLSDHPNDRMFRANQRSEHIKALLRSLGISKFSLVMHDWGGPIGTHLALGQPENIERLVYLNTTLTETESLPLFIKMSAKPIPGRFMTQGSKRFLKFLTDWGVTKKLPKAVKEGYLAPYKSAKDRLALWGFVRDIPFDSDHPTYPEMMQIAQQVHKLASKPVQVIWGLKDACFHRGILEKFLKHFPHARVRELLNASHLVIEDQPKIVIDTICEFLAAPLASVLDQSLNQSSLGSGSPKSTKTAGDSISTAVLPTRFESWAEKFAEQESILIPRCNGQVIQSTSITYNELAHLIYRYQRGLESLGLAYGDRVLMLVTPGIDFIALSYAIMRHGAIPVFIDPGIEKAHFFECILDLEAQAFIGSPKAQLLRLLKPQLFKNMKFVLTASNSALFKLPFLSSANLSDLKSFAPQPALESRANPTAMIAFTSGATGKPKGVIFTQEMIEAQLKIFSEQFGLTAGKRDLPLLPIFSLFSMALGLSCVFPKIDPAHPLSLDPAEISQLINELKVSYCFGSPTLWRKIAEYCVRTNTSLVGLEKVLMAGAAVGRETLKLVQSVLPNGEAFTPYGSSEALPVTFVSGREIERSKHVLATGGEEGVYVGKPVKGVEVRIIAIEAKAISNLDLAKQLPAQQIGEIIVRALNVSPAYLNRKDADALSKIIDGETFWHRMGDVGYLDQEGNLYYCGRKAHMVQARERTYYPEPVEKIFNEHPKVKRSALVKLSKSKLNMANSEQSESEVAAIVIEPLDQHFPENPDSESTFVEELKDLASTSTLTASIEKFYFHKSFPVDRRHNAKIYRDRLSEWADKQPGKQPCKQPDKH